MKEISIKGIIGWDVFAEDVRKELPAGKEQIRLLINSEGGEIYEAFEIYNLLKEYPGKVTARITALAASAAADIFFGADEREFYTHSALMYHRAWTLTIGNAEELRKEAGILDALDKIRIRDFASVTGKNLETAMAEFTGETWLIGDEQIRGAGISGTLVGGGEPEVITEPAARLRVTAAIGTLKEARDIKDIAARSREKIAALARPEQNTPANAVVYKNDEGGAAMELNEFLAQPGAVEKVLAYAKDKIGPGADEAKKAESDRILGIFALAGLTIPDDVKTAVAGNTTPEAYAVNVLTKQRETEAALQKKPLPITPAPVAQLPGEQGIKTKPEGDPVTAETVKEIAAGIRR
ncbi:MAG: Clp protease ClpP [Treponema sp.]|jgi:ATP-dependent protease ClpP protease subunit|nr:Clp protease ClpP [Treponema sp.]